MSEVKMFRSKYTVYLSLGAALALLAACEDLTRPPTRPAAVTPERPLMNVGGGACVAPPSDLVAWWPGDGTYNDIIGDNTLAPSPTGVSFATGVAASAFNFDGSGRAERFSDALKLVGGAGVTVSAWVRVDADLAATPGYLQSVPIAAKWGSSAFGTAGYGLFLLEPRNVGLLIAVDGGGHFQISGPRLESGTWYHLAGTYDAATAMMRLYINGVPASDPVGIGQSNLGRQVYPTPAPWVTAGYNPEWSNIGLAFQHLIGMVDEVQVFSRALSGAEIESVANAGAPGQCKSDTPPVAVPGGPYAGIEGTPFAFDGSASSDADGDAIVSYEWNFGDGSIGTGPVATHTYADNGTYPVTLTVTDSRGVRGSSTTTAVVDNVAPEVEPVTAPLDPVPVNTAVTVSASFVDRGAADVHTAVIDWNANGVSATSGGAVTESGGAGTVTGSHTYTAPGVYTIKLTITDDDGGSASSVFQYVVVYDPSAGFVTGGGWIDSPAGAYAPDPAVAGKATFGFVAKYKAGAEVPDGNTQFHFNAANLKFSSTSYDWLVVAGGKAKFKGEGTINGVGGYAFMLTAIDGQANSGGEPDKLRLKIWVKATGEVVYDNQSGANDDGNAATALGGGSIVVHAE